MNEIGAVGHRVLHGGEKFTASCLIDDTPSCAKAIEENIPLGPLHNPANLMGIRACQAVMPEHAPWWPFSTPPSIRPCLRKGLPLRRCPTSITTQTCTCARYGFHGTSHRYRLRPGDQELLGPARGYPSVIICHLGNGSSLSACVDGKCVDTSMGLTPAGRPGDGHPFRQRGSRRGGVHLPIRKGISVTECAEHAEQEVRSAGRLPALPPTCAT